MRRRCAAGRALLGFAAILAAGCLWAGPARSAAGGPVAAAASDPASDLARARGLVRYGRFEEALDVLRRLLRGSVVDAGVLFNIGLAAVGASQRPGLPAAARDALLDEAIAAFRRMLIDRPGLVRVRLELARAFFLKREDGLSREHFERVLAGNPPPPIAANVRRFLAEIRARRRWSFRVGSALAADSNIGSESETRVFYIGPYPFVRDRERLTRSGLGIALWAGGEYQEPLNSELRLRIGADVTRREYRGGRYDQTTIAGHVGPRWLIDRDTELSLLPGARWHWRAGEVVHRDLGARAELVRRLGRRATATARGSRHYRRYRVRESLNGPILDVSLDAAWAATPTVRFDGGLGWGSERPHAESHRLTRRRISAGVSVDLPGGFTAGTNGRMEWTAYGRNWFPYITDGGARNDRTWSLRLSAHNRRFTLGGFSPQVSVVRSVRETNAQLFDYRRTAGELRFVRLF